MSDGSVLFRYAKLIKRIGDEGSKAQLTSDELTLGKCGDAFVTGYQFGSIEGSMFGAVLPHSIPKSATTLQLALVIANYLDKHPEQMSAGSWPIMAAAFAEAFPNPQYGKFPK